MDFDRFKDRFQLIDDRIMECLSGEPKRLYEASRHLSKAGGKRIRPLICLLSCEAVGGKADECLETAVATELIHTFTLIHDDIMDNDELRRGVPSVHQVYGEATAILAGDLLFSKAFEISNPKAMNVLAKAASDICEGQQMDISFAESKVVTEEEYLEMVRKKTAVLIQAASESGALLGGGSKDEVKGLSVYGLSIGMAFQIHDDVLDLLADEETLGKPVGSDVVEGKRSLIVIKALDSLNRGGREELLGILDKETNTQEEIARAVSLFDESKAITYCKNKAKHFIMSAKKALEQLPKSDAKNDLMEIADFIVQRKK
ncbi:MAG: polyprenyl synthetase family protein [Candidatus Altiarchaeota archaeon]|nr:polyprenyl synthetase family protein [Candidatus Altiarchaeota archaeon]